MRRLTADVDADALIRVAIFILYYARLCLTIIMIYNINIIFRFDSLYELLFYTPVDPNPPCPLAVGGLSSSSVSTI